MRAIHRYASLMHGYYISRRTPVLVYSSERSGSTLVYESLKRHGELAVVTHGLDASGAERISGSAKWVLRHVLPGTRRYKVVSLVRDPVDTMLSTFARFCHDQVVRETGNPAASAGDIAPRFGPEYLEKRGYDRQLTWFEDHLEKHLGIDVYAHPFDTSRRCTQLATPRCDVLLLRTELDDRAKSRAIGEFIGHSDFTMAGDVEYVRRNYEASGKPGEQAAYAESYKALKRTAEIPDDHWAYIRASRLARHFFTPEELEKSRARYVRARANTA